MESRERVKKVLTGGKILKVREDSRGQGTDGNMCQGNGLWDLGWCGSGLAAVSSCTAQTSNPFYLTHPDLQLAI